MLAVLVCGYKIFRSGIISILNFRFSEKTLITIASVASLFINEAIEALLILVFFRIGESLEKIAKGETRKSINKISKIIPDSANLIFNNTESKVPSMSLSVGDIFIVHPFERIPCDGTIIEGETYLNLSAITGESLPVLANVGSCVLSGSINTTGTIKVKTEKIAKESMAGKILNLIESGTKNKAKVETVVGKFSQKYTLVVILIAMLLFFIPILLFGMGNFIFILKRSLSFLVTSCPCSIVISVPLAFFCGIGKSASLNILFKGSKYIEALSKVNTIFLDKTGTLTKGSLEIERIYMFAEEYQESDVLNLCANAEFYSCHPIAKALVEKAGLRKSKTKNTKEFPGYGIKTTINDEEILCGNLKFLKENGVKLNNEPVDITLYLAVNNNLVGGINFYDELKPTSKETIKKLHKMNINAIILSGDKKEPTQKIAEKCGIPEFYSGLMPEDKLSILNKNNGSNFAFVGDGINDSPAIASVNCGIAVGTGSDIALETAGIVLLSDIALLPKAIQLAKKTMSIIKLNFYFAICVKMLVLLFSFLFFMPTYLAVFADVGVTLISVVNAVSLGRR